jgi:hypothetical protein
MRLLALAQAHKVAAWLRVSSRTVEVTRANLTVLQRCRGQADDTARRIQSLLRGTDKASAEAGDPDVQAPVWPRLALPALALDAAASATALDPSYRRARARVLRLWRRLSHARPPRPQHPPAALADAELAEWQPAAGSPWLPPEPASQRRVLLAAALLGEGALGADADEEPGASATGLSVAMSTMSSASSSPPAGLPDAEAWVEWACARVYGGDSAALRESLEHALAEYRAGGEDEDDEDDDEEDPDDAAADADGSLRALLERPHLPRVALAPQPAPPADDLVDPDPAPTPPPLPADPAPPRALLRWVTRAAEGFAQALADAVAPLGPAPADAAAPEEARALLAPLRALLAVDAVARSPLAAPLAALAAGVGRASPAVEQLARDSAAVTEAAAGMEALLEKLAGKAGHFADAYRRAGGPIADAEDAALQASDGAPDGPCVLAKHRLLAPPRAAPPSLPVSWCRATAGFLAEHADYFRSCYESLYAAGARAKQCTVAGKAAAKQSAAAAAALDAVAALALRWQPSCACAEQPGASTSTSTSTDTNADADPDAAPACACVRVLVWAGAAGSERGVSASDGPALEAALLHADSRAHLRVLAQAPADAPAGPPSLLCVARAARGAAAALLRRVRALGQGYAHCLAALGALLAAKRQDHAAFLAQALLALRYARKLAQAAQAEAAARARAPPVDTRFLPAAVQAAVAPHLQAFAPDQPHAPAAAPALALLPQRPALTIRPREPAPGRGPPSRRLSSGSFAQPLSPRALGGLGSRASSSTALSALAPRGPVPLATPSSSPSLSPHPHPRAHSPALSASSAHPAHSGVSLPPAPRLSLSSHPALRPFAPGMASSPPLSTSRPASLLHYADPHPHSSPAMHAYPHPLSASPQIAARFAHPPSSPQIVALLASTPSSLPPPLHMHAPTPPLAPSPSPPSASASASDWHDLDSDPLAAAAAPAPSAPIPIAPHHRQPAADAFSLGAPALSASPYSRALTPNAFPQSLPQSLPYASSRAHSHSSSFFPPQQSLYPSPGEANHMVFQPPASPAKQNDQGKGQ